jgi:uncharacterized membrane protein YeaQ/YmgE (transglycosylase-associated protein family)
VGVLGWLFVGFIAGGLARFVTRTEKRGCLGTIAVGIIGALIGGALFRFATGDEIDAFDEVDLGSILVAFAGAVLLLLLLDALGSSGRRRRRRRRRARR